MEELTAREQSIVRETRERLARWGHHADIPAPPHVLAALVIKLAARVEALEAELATLRQEAADVPALREQLVLAHRRLGAAKAREAKLRQQVESNDTEDCGAG